VCGKDDSVPEGAYPAVICKFLLHCLVFPFDKLEEVRGQVLGGFSLKPVVVPKVSLGAVSNRDYGS
jgi:hypothetical protein